MRKFKLINALLATENKQLPMQRNVNYPGGMDPVNLCHQNEIITRTENESNTLSKLEAEIWIQTRKERTRGERGTMATRQHILHVSVQHH